jgi:hypothetical protein
LLFRIGTFQRVTADSNKKIFLASDRYSHSLSDIHSLSSQHPQPFRFWFGDREQYTIDSGLMEEIVCISDSRAIRAKAPRIGFVDRMEVLSEVFFLDSMWRAWTIPRRQSRSVAAAFQRESRIGWPNRLRNL